MNVSVVTLDKSDMSKAKFTLKGAEIQMSTLDPYMSTVATRQYYASGRERDALKQATFMKLVTKK